MGVVDVALVTGPGDGAISGLGRRGLPQGRRRWRHSRPGLHRGIAEAVGISDRAMSERLRRGVTALIREASDVCLRRERSIAGRLSSRGGTDGVGIYPWLHRCSYWWL